MADLTTDPLFDVSAFARKLTAEDPDILTTEPDDLQGGISDDLKKLGEIPRPELVDEIIRALHRIGSAGKVANSRPATSSKPRPPIRGPSGPMLAAFAAITHMDDAAIGDVIGLHAKTVGVQRRAGENESIKPAQRKMLLMAAKEQRDALDAYIEKHKFV